jgi:type IV secretory pathway TraG/TraD family ATPase VirD4
VSGDTDPADGFSPAGVLAEGTVLLVVLAPGELGAAASLLGTLLLPAIQQAAFALAGAGKPHFLYLDEFHLFATTGFTEFLAMARSYRVGAVLAHQHLGQLPADLREAVLANARSRLILGGLSSTDAGVVAEMAGRSPPRRGRRALRYDPTVIRELPRGTALVHLAGRRPFLGRVRPTRI